MPRKKGKKIVIVILIVFVLLGSLGLYKGNIQGSLSVMSEINRVQAQIRSFNVTVLSPNKVKLCWNIETNSENVTVEIRRKFLDKWSTIAVVPAEQGVFIDKYDLFWGTEYRYEIDLLGKNGTIITSSDPIRVITPVDESNCGKPIFSWNEYKQNKYYFFPSDYLEFNESFQVYTYYIHGVNVTVAIHKDNYNIVKDTVILDFVKNVFKFFHRHWMVFKAFPINEYRVVVYNNDEGFYSENELGLRYGPSMLISWGGYPRGPDEKLSHEIGHAWIGVGLLIIEREYEGGNFDPTVQDSDRWIKEGFDHFYGIVHLKYYNSKLYLEEDLRRYKTELLGTDIDLPLVDLPIYFDTEYMWTYYVKGGLVAYLINKILIDNDDKTLNEFMNLLYKKYNITTTYEMSLPEKKISTEDLLEELNAFSSYNFTDFFSKYVYGVEPLPIGSIEYKYVEALRVYNETRSIAIDIIPPMIEIISPANGTILNNKTVLLEWVAHDIGVGVEHFELRVDNQSWINVGKSSSYLLSNLKVGKHVVIIKAYDLVGNTEEINLVFEIESGTDFTFILIPITVVTVISAGIIVIKRNK